MIKLQDKSDCCGCGACAQICSKHCITLFPDEEGFLYPHVDVSSCIGCDLCEKVCPVLHLDISRKPIQTLAVRNLHDDIRAKSSSGGVFSTLAFYVLGEGGVVFGAAFDDSWQVVHKCVERIEDLHILRGSKYVQSVIGDSYIKVRAFLKQGRKVLFTGTPCQIAGLRHYLRRDFENLYLVDIACHGVPSPKVWDMYLKEEFSKPIKAINFRDKTHGWDRYSLSIEGEEGWHMLEHFRDNLYGKGYLKNLFIRPSCYHCPFRKGKSGSQLMLADLWGIDNIIPEINDDKGCSLVLVYQQKHLPLENCLVREIDAKQALRYNGGIETRSDIPKQRKTFFKLLASKGVKVSIERFTRKKKIDSLMFFCKHLLYIVMCKLLKR